ncbi:LysR family transcriptional regulator [Zooshikella ganghwensis]|uniref:LysR family transcriptional regulator n=1 Tax=Zooshikella ganghwensis TaxID=202772 RepID=A0A4V1IN54_9GAMM|nr:LysR family transcriptional regulator [Zooshikella ganghwensis]RDH42541.1 LysR family transcriptional regulator [Zooshikella ganghwensis]
MDTLKQLQAFIHVVEASSFSLAADELEVANGIVSKWVHNLESMLGCQLLVRKGNSVSLSNRGAEVYRQASELLNSYQKLLNVAAENQSKGMVRLCIPRIYGDIVLFPLLLTFCTMYPDIMLDIHMSDQKKSIFKNGYDVVLRIGDIPEQDVVARCLGNLSVVLVAPIDCVDINRLTDKEYIKKIPVILHNNCRRNCLERFLDMKLNESQVAMQISSSHNVLKAVQTKKAMTIIPYYQAKEALLRRELVQLLPNLKLTSKALNIIYPNREFVSPQAKKLINFIVDNHSELVTS